MKFTALSQLDKRKSADILVLPFFKKEKTVTEAGHFSSLRKSYALPVEAKDFGGKEGEILLLYSKDCPEKRIALVGLGDEKKLTVEKLRRTYAGLAKACLVKNLKSINLLLPQTKHLEENKILHGALEGILLSNYSYKKLKRKNVKEEPKNLLEQIHIIGKNKPAANLKIAEEILTVAQSIYMVRDLVNGNADDITPQYLAKTAKDIAKTLPKTHVKVLGRKEIEKEKMGLLLAVNRGSDKDPELIILNYKGNPKSKEHTILVGKGVTYDTGGLNLKPTGSMETMKCDMAGAATVLGIVQAAASLGLPVNVTAVVPTTENSISSRSFKPGDVYFSHDGTSVEIGNTDAEGRLILADALSYAVKNLKPTRIIDFATLTGAIDIALGAEASGLFCNDDKLAKQLADAGEQTYERVWRLPIYEEYRDQLQSDIADIRNIGGRSAGSTTAALFLKEFIGDVPWAHLDIASTAFFNDAKRYHPKFGTGIGVRLLINFLSSKG